MLRIEVYAGRKWGRQQWRFRIRSGGNFKVLAVSGEAYTNRADALSAIGLLTAAMPESAYTVVYST